MKERFYLFRRREVYYVQDSSTGCQQSLKTKDRREAERIWRAKNEAARAPMLNVALAKAYLSHHDPHLCERLWQDVMEEFCKRGKPDTQTTRRRVTDRKGFSVLRKRKLIETTAEDFMTVLNQGGVMVHSFLRCMHNLALGLGWLPWPVLPNKLWPAVETKKKRGVTCQEHQQIINAEQNDERRLYYEILWETGAAQTDAALLQAASIDWEKRILSYQRKKTGEWAYLQIGKRLESLLLQLPSEGYFFPKIAKGTNSTRSAEFARRCRLLKIKGISLHSFRYAWAQRAKSCGYPERWAQNALGHTSRAVHQAYAREGFAVCPPLEAFENQAAASPASVNENVGPPLKLTAGGESPHTPRRLPPVSEDRQLVFLRNL